MLKIQLLIVFSQKLHQNEILERYRNVSQKDKGFIENFFQNLSLAQIHT